MELKSLTREQRGQSNYNGQSCMAVTTLRQMAHTEIDDSFKSELRGRGGGGGLGGSPK